VQEREYTLDVRALWIHRDINAAKQRYFSLLDGGGKGEEVLDRRREERLRPEVHVDIILIAAPVVVAGVHAGRFPPPLLLFPGESADLRVYPTWIGCGAKNYMESVNV